MKIAVCVKEVLDARLSLKVLPQGGVVVQLDSERITLINPADRAALEVALQIRNQIPGSQLGAFSVCDADRQGALHYALARGADSAERLVPDTNLTGPPYTALALTARFERENLQLICCGDETLDNSSGMVGPLLAELLELPQVTGVSRVRECDEVRLLVERSLECGHRELVEVDLPAVATFKAEAAEPQYVSVRRLEFAQRKGIPARFVKASNISSASLPQWPSSERKVPARARVKKRFVPDASLPAAERVRIMMGGGLTPAPSSQNSPVLEGDPEYLSEQLFRYLRHNEFV